MTLMEIDITKQCEAGLEFSRSDEALVYLYAPVKPEYADLGHRRIGLFDKNGFHYMDSERVGTTYRVESGYMANKGITWFKVYEISDL